jgi:GntR family transcriptional repressor for pyruvate dehydrogenase complex
MAARRQTARSDGPLIVGRSVTADRIELMHEISGLVKETRIESLSQEDRPRASLEGHRRIAEAIRRQDSAEASRAMADHIRLVSDVALLRESN